MSPLCILPFLSRPSSSSSWLKSSQTQPDHFLWPYTCWWKSDGQIYFCQGAKCFKSSFAGEWKEGPVGFCSRGRGSGREGGWEVIQWKEQGKEMKQTASRGRLGLGKLQLGSCRQEVPSGVKLVSSCRALRTWLAQSLVTAFPMAVSPLKRKQRKGACQLLQGYMESFLFLTCFWQPW